MKRFLQLLVVLVYIAACCEATHENTNAGAFNTLCSIYRLALGARGDKFIHKAVFSVPSQEMEEVNRLYALTAPEEYFEFGQSPLPPQITDDQKEKIKKAWEARKQGWIDHKVSGAPGEDRKKYERLQPGPARELANKKIRRIRDTLTMVNGEVERIATEASSTLNASKKLAADAIYGKGQDKIDDSSFTTNYATSCGGAAGAEGPGKSIINDMVCLCVGASDSYGKGKCGNQRFATPLRSKHFGGLSTAKQAWTELEKECAGAAGETPPTADAILAELAAFKSHVGAKAGVTAKLEFVLGQVVDSQGCDGNADNGQVCVNYHTQLADKKGDFSGIPWYKNMLDLSEKEKTLRKLEQQAELLKARAAGLEERAWDAYLEGQDLARLDGVSNKQSGTRPNETSRSQDENPTHRDQYPAIRSVGRFPTKILPISVLLACASYS